MKLFWASQSPVVHIEAVLTSNQSPVWPAKIFQRFIDSGLQALFVTVFQTSVDFLSKNSYKSSSLLGYFDCFFSNHTVGCCDINFSCLSQIRSEKFSFASNVSIFLLYFLRNWSCFDATFGQLFTLRPPYFCFCPTAYAHSLLKNDFFSNVHG